MKKPSLRQQRVAEQIIENAKRDVPKTGAELVAASGYGPSMSKNPHVIMNSVGVKLALNVAGFTETKAAEVVAELLGNSEVDPNARLKAADMTFKVHGTYAPEKSVNLNVDVNTKDPKAIELAERYERELRDSL